MKKLEYKSGQYIFKAGDKGKEIFLLMSGDVGLFLPTNDTKEPNFMIGENEVFGEMGVIEHKPRMASARCMSDATVIALSESEFEARVEKADPFIRALEHWMSEIIDEIPRVYNTPEIRIDCDDDKKFLLIENVTKSQKKLKKNS